MTKATARYCDRIFRNRNCERQPQSTIFQPPARGEKTLDEVDNSLFVILSLFYLLKKERF